MGGAEFEANLIGTETSTSVFLSYWVRFDPLFSGFVGANFQAFAAGDVPVVGRSSQGKAVGLRDDVAPGGAGEVYAYLFPRTNTVQSLDSVHGKLRWGAGIASPVNWS